MLSSKTLETFSVATWNVNSLKVRLPQVLEWLTQHAVDVLALQETKLTDLHFPVDAFKEIGYHAYFVGQPTYNGVALITRTEGSDPENTLPGAAKPEQRLIALTVGDVRIISVYVPNGSEVGSEKYAWKLSWLKNLQDYLQEQLSRYPKLIVLGDYNIAPHDLDVHDPVLWHEKILCSTPERQALQSLLDLELSDLMRHLHPNETIYTWWDYRQAAFRRNLGLRIDHILVSPPLVKTCVSCNIDLAPRKHERPSDHIPVIAYFKLEPFQLNSDRLVK